MEEVRDQDSSFFFRINAICRGVFYASSYASCFGEVQEEFYKDDLKEHKRLQYEMLNSLEEIGIGVKSHNRRKIAIAASTLSEMLEQYGALVRRHLERSNGNAFLDYPYDLGENFIDTPFNSQRSLDGLKNELERFDEIIKRFDAVNYSLGEVRVNGKLQEIEDLISKLRA